MVAARTVSGFAAGVMVWVVVAELLPEAFGYVRAGPVGRAAIIVFVVMVAGQAPITA